MADDIGWKIRGKFYPLVHVDDWTRGDHILASRVTGLGDELFDGGHAVALDTAYLAVAVWRQNPGLALERVQRFVFELKDSDVQDVGLTEVDGEGDDAGPPDGGAATADSSSSPESGEAASEST